MTTWKNSAQRAIENGLITIKVLPPLPLDVWAEENFNISSDNSHYHGKWVSYPYQRAILFVFGHSDIEEVDVRKSSRTGYTKMLLAASSYFTIFKKYKQAIWQPTDGDAQDFVNDDYDIMLNDVKGFKKIFPSLGKKHKYNTVKFKKFIGASTRVLGGTSAKNFRRITLDVGMMDELSAFDKDVCSEGSSRKLAKKRTEGAPFPKFITGSTPKLKYSCEISKAVEEADAIYKFYVPCPHCNKKQVLEFGGKEFSYGLKWVNNDPETAAYACKYCNALFTQAEYMKISDKGIWIDAAGNWIDVETHEFRNSRNEIIRPQKHIAMDKMWTIYSPQTTWIIIAKEFIDAVKKAKHGDKTDLKSFINTTLGEEYEEDVEQTDAGELQKRGEDFPLQVVPIGGLILKAGIDIQKDRFELVVWAIGASEEMWTIDYQIIEANPTIQSDFDKLDPYLLRSYPHVAGTRLHIESAAIDTGNWTHQAYQYVRSRKLIQNWVGLEGKQHPPKLFGTKGVGTAGKPISSKPSFVDINAYDRVIKRGLKLYSIGTEEAKTLFHNRLQLTQPGPGYVHLSKHLPVEFFQHITNEVWALRYTKKGEVRSWEPRRSGARNECLDCTVMVLFLASKAGLHNKTKSYWSHLESIIQPNQGDLFSLPLHDTDDTAILAPVDKNIGLPSHKKQNSGFNEVNSPW